MAHTLVVTKDNGKIISASFSGNELVSLHAEAAERTVVPGSIYVGKIMQLLPVVNAAFVKVAGEENWYLPLEKCSAPVGAVSHADGKLHAGDEILVQVEKEAAKKKTVTVIGDFSLTGCNFVLMHGSGGIHVSKKITDKEAEKRVVSLTERLLADLKSEEMKVGVMLRTNSANASDDALAAELTTLFSEYGELLLKAKSSFPGTCLRKGYPNYLCELRDGYADQIERLVTDDSDIYSDMRQYLSAFRPEALGQLSLYENESVSLFRVYNLKARISELLGKKVWLKSGAYLVIEQTEAMVVIDVNSGKGTAAKRSADLFLSVNLEAAKEICRQLRLRSLSGIIMVDFINMKSDSEKTELLNFIRSELKKDRVKSELVEMTKLDLVEITRAKVARPLSEEFRSE